MKDFTGIKMGIRGDIALMRIKELPEGVVPHVPENGVYVVAHSETGHHHVVDQRRAQVYTHPEHVGSMFMVVEEDVELQHRRAHDTHETVKFDAGVFRINRQREYTPQGFRNVAD